MLYGHGDDGYRYGKQVRADFSTNVWYGGEPKGLKEYVFSKWDDINRYPEVIGESLIQKIAEHHVLSNDQILVANGTTESIYLIAQLFQGKKTTIVTPSFSEYEDACAIHGHELQFISWKESLELPHMESDVLFICNPNNPTGLTSPDLAEWLVVNPHCVFVVDEAFIDFSPGIPSLIDRINNFDNLIVMRSLTKLYAIPGLRLGYIASTNDWINALKRIKQPWSVNSLALAAGTFIFDHYPQIHPPIGQLLLEKEEFVKGLRRNDVLEVTSSETHFFLVKTMVRDANQLKRFLLENFQLLIRDAGNFRGLSRQHFRIATLSSENNLLLINALEEWTKQHY